MKFKSTKSMSAAELMAQLQSDPEWVRKNADREAQQKTTEAQLSQEEKPLLTALADAGFPVASVWDLVNANTSYEAAISVLVEHLRLPYPPKIREGIARALTVQEARGVAGLEILAELKRHDGNAPREVRWALANALTVVGEASMTEEINTLIADVRNEDVREILNLALKNLAASSARSAS